MVHSTSDAERISMLRAEIETLKAELSEQYSAVQHASDLQDDAETCRDQWIIMAGNKQLRIGELENVVRSFMAFQNAGYLAGHPFETTYSQLVRDARTILGTYRRERESE